MRKLIYIVCVVLIGSICLNCSQRNQGEVILTLKGEGNTFLSNRSCLWSSLLTLENDTLNDAFVYKGTLVEPDVFVLRVGFVSTFIYLEPGERLTIESCPGGNFRFSGDEKAVRRALLLDSLRKERTDLLNYQRQLTFAKQRGKNYTGKVVDTLETYRTCDELIAAFEREGVGCTESFKRYLAIDQKYFVLSNRIVLPPYLNKTYHPLTPEELEILSETVKDAGIKEASLSLFYRQMARAYMDYLRINDPEGRMGAGEEYLENELRLGDYFGKGDVADMLRAFNLDMIGYQHAGDTAYQRVVGLLPEKWQISLKHYFPPRTEVKGRKISAAVEYPVFEGVTPDGKRVSLKDFSGKWVFVDCWATWCGPCNFEIPYVGYLEEALKDKNVVFLGISVDRKEDTDKWKAFVAEKGLKGVQILCDDADAIYKQFGIAGIPHFALIDPSGRLVKNGLPRPSTGVPHHLLEGMIK